MEGKEVRVNWRAAIVFGEDGNIIHGRVRRIGRKRMVLSADRNLPSGGRCEVALQPPRESADGATAYVRGRAEIVMSVLASMQFQITARWLELDANSERVLDEQIERVLHR